MAGRTNYTYTAIYNRSFAKPGKFQAAGANGRSYALEPLDRDEDNTGRGDTPVLALLFFVLPILGLFAILLQPMRWIFTAAAALSLLTMWALRCFMPRARIAISLVLAALVALAVYGAMALPITDVNQGNNTGSNITDPSDLLGALTSETEDDGLTDYDEGGALAVQGNQPEAMPLSAAQTVLEAYLELWKQGNNIEGMIEYTWPEWRRAIENPQITLYTSLSQRKLQDWEYTMPAFSDMDTVITIPVLTHMTTNSGTFKFRHEAMLYRVGDQWYVDPNSFKSSIQVVDPTPSPDPNATPKPTPAASVSPSLKLWYNSDGGSLYHTKKDCSSIAQRYWSKMSSFTFSQLKDNKYSKLKPCTVCGSPERP
ncbi:MAG: hypothetical protein LBS11_03025 [Oscillospiraceae bacterium]|jgi:hypothetical protein|nr:hypothetical protein [Oscillospiraceae bacterium]